jgi:hypothetical protein
MTDTQTAPAADLTDVGYAVVTAVTTTGESLTPDSTLTVDNLPVLIPAEAPQASGPYAYTLRGRIDHAIREAGYRRTGPFWRSGPDQVTCPVTPKARTR